jgi:heme-degrading monooxygenase HmoA
MFARVVRVQITPEKAEQMASWKPTPELQAVPGFKGAYILFDRNSNKGMAVVLWENEKALLDSANVVTPIRAQFAKDVGAIWAPVVEEYEVVTEP